MKSVKATIRQILDGKKCFSSKYQQLLHKMRKNRDPLNRCLSPRQIMLMRYLGSGCSVDQIATELQIARSTVTWHTQQIRTLLDIDTTREVAERARQAGFTLDRDRRPDWC